MTPKSTITWSQTKGSCFKYLINDCHSERTLFLMTGMFSYKDTYDKEEKEEEEEQKSTALNQGLGGHGFRTNLDLQCRLFLNECIHVYHVLTNVNMNTVCLNIKWLHKVRNHFWKWDPYFFRRVFISKLYSCKIEGEIKHVPCFIWLCLQLERALNWKVCGTYFEKGEICHKKTSRCKKIKHLI